MSALKLMSPTGVAHMINYMHNDCTLMGAFINDPMLDPPKPCVLLSWIYQSAHPLFQSSSSHARYGAIQVLRNADGGGGVKFFGKKALRRCKIQRY